MAVTPNDPIDKVRELQRKLYTAAKHSPTRRFHALFDRIHRGDVLMEAWERVRANRGAAGIDKTTLEMIEQQGVPKFLAELQALLKTGKYHPQPVRRTYIPKPDGKQRPLGIPTVRDRVAQAAAKIVIEPIFEADFKDCSFGFRPKKSATDALERIRLVGGRGHYFVVDGDIKSYFDTIDQGLLMQLVERRISDRKTLKLLRKWLQAGVMEEGAVRHTDLGTPQGGVISPLLANIFLDFLDSEWLAKCSHLGQLVRYADDFVVLCKTRAAADEALLRLRDILGRLRLELHPEKTRIAELGLGKDGFVFLGCYLRIVQSHFRGRRYLFRWPSPRAMNSIRAKIRALTSRQRWAGMTDLLDVVKVLNPLLRGWGNYFRTGNASLKFQQVDSYVRRRLLMLLQKRGGDRRKPVRSRDWPITTFVELFGLHRLVGTIRYPGGVHAT